MDSAAPLKPSLGHCGSQSLGEHFSEKRPRNQSKQRTIQPFGKAIRPDVVLFAQFGGVWEAWESLSEAWALQEPELLNFGALRECVA